MVWYYIGVYIEDITLWHKDMNFIFEWQNNNFMNERSELNIVFATRKKIISSSRHVMFHLSYKQKDINKLIDFYLQKSDCDSLYLQYLHNIGHSLQ